MKRFLTYILLLFQIGMIISLVKGIQETLQAKNRVTDLETKKTTLTQEKQKLEAQYRYAQSFEYLERVARDELHLSKPGEEVVIVPEEMMGSGGGEKKVEGEREIPNYLKWWEVFMGNEVK